MQRSAYNIVKEHLERLFSINQMLNIFIGVAGTSIHAIKNLLRHVVLLPLYRESFIKHCWYNNYYI